MMYPPLDEMYELYGRNVLVELDIRFEPLLADDAVARLGGYFRNSGDCPRAMLAVFTEFAKEAKPVQEVYAAMCAQLIPLMETIRDYGSPCHSTGPHAISLDGLICATEKIVKNQGT
jgi:hypothetical protein